MKANKITFDRIRKAQSIEKENQIYDLVKCATPLNRGLISQQLAGLITKTY